jgi:hypothetical protein
MTATNKSFEGMTNDADSATLAGVAEAVEWTHGLEDGLPKRVTRRIVIYPPTLTEFSRVISGDFSKNYHKRCKTSKKKREDAYRGCEFKNDRAASQEGIS